MNWTEVTRLQGNSRVKSQVEVNDISNGRFFTVWELSRGGCLIFHREKKDHGQHHYVDVQKDSRGLTDIVQALREGAELFNEKENGS
jgi:hypothetical protein